MLLSCLVWIFDFMCFCFKYKAMLLLLLVVVYTFDAGECSEVSFRVK